MLYSEETVVVDDAVVVSLQPLPFVPSWNVVSWIESEFWNAHALVPRDSRTSDQIHSALNPQQQ